MGNGRWAPATYYDKAADRARTGADTFAYSKAAIQSGRLRVHQTLDPQGLQMRESRDSDEHPNSNAVIISLDVTGSMGKVVRGIHANLPQLHELLLGHKYISDPQICFAAVGDATCDQVPLQLGQFESDNRMDENLENMILEGGGGGQNTESYELMLYFAARHTELDCWQKRQRKGYLFVIGDEMAYGAVSAAQVQRLTGHRLQADIPLKQIVDEVQQRYHLYFIIPGGASHGRDKNILNFWNNAIGAERIIKLQSPDETSQCIALTIGLNEKTIDLPAAVTQMQKQGLLAKTIQSIHEALRSLLGGDANNTGAGRNRRL
jgi:hypothetical protein